MSYDEEYFRQMSKGLIGSDVLANSLIAHNQTVGVAREEKLRKALGKYLPSSICIGTGFAVAGDQSSGQMDVLLYSADAPTLDRDEKQVFVSSDAVRGIVEVKTSFDPRDVKEACEKLAKAAAFIRRRSISRLFVGLFAFEDRGTVSFEMMGRALLKATDGFEDRIIPAVCWGASKFIRYLSFAPEQPMKPIYAWRAYSLPESAPSAFVCDLVREVSPAGPLGGTAVFPTPETEKFREEHDFPFRSRKWFPEDYRTG
jgi:hypothetical protein